MIETALLFFFAAAYIIGAALTLISLLSKVLSKGRTYGAGNWPQPITKPPKMPKNTEGWDG